MPSLKLTSWHRQLRCAGLTRNGLNRCSSTRGTMNKFTVHGEAAALAAAKIDYRWLIERDGFDVGIYRPDKVDTQTPHARDELYVVASGTGRFVVGAEAQ